MNTPPSIIVALFMSLIAVLLTYLLIDDVNMIRLSNERDMQRAVSLKCVVQWRHL